MLALNNIEVDGAEVVLDDRTHRKRLVASDIGIGIPFLSSLPHDAEIRVTPRFEGTFDGTRFAMRANATSPFADTREATLEWNLDALPLPKYAEYMALPGGIRLVDGALTAAYPPVAARLKRWRNARISVSGRPDWVFIKLYCHGFFTGDQETTLGYPTLKFWSEAIESADRGGRFKIHFATAREAFNIAMGAVDVRDGDPNVYRDYRLIPIRKSPEA